MINRKAKNYRKLTFSVVSRSPLPPPQSMGANPEFSCSSIQLCSYQELMVEVEYIKGSRNKSDLEYAEFFKKKLKSHFKAYRIDGPLTELPRLATK